MSTRHLGLGLAALLIVAAGFSTTATFQSSGPGHDLAPVGGAEELIQLVQGRHSVLWTSLVGSIGLLQVLGWPSSDGVHDLGGALVMENVGGDAGAINIGEKPMTVEFSIDG